MGDVARGAVPTRLRLTEIPVRAAAQFHWTTLAATLLVLAALGVEAAFVRPHPADYDEHHRAIRRAVDAMPTSFGEWEGAPYRLPAPAIETLDPNATVSLQFQHRDTGELVRLIIVHCDDARDVEGRCPAIYYPTNGWHEQHAAPMQWTVEGEAIRGVEYEFRDSSLGGSILIVDSFMVYPNHYAATVDAVKRDAWDYQSRYRGAAAVQVVFDRTRQRISPARRRAIFREIIGAYLPLIEQVKAGPGGTPNTWGADSDTR